MTYVPGPTEVPPPMVGPFSAKWSDIADYRSIPSEPSSATYAAAGYALYFPIHILAPCVVRRVWWANGATVSGGATIAVGVYRSADFAPSAKIISGSATQGNANEVQFVDVTDTSLPIGLHWVAISASTTTNTTLFRSNMGIHHSTVLYHEASASPLPSTATPSPTSYATVYLCGFATTSSP